MSPASKSKSKEKKVVKDVQKVSVKPSTSVNATNGVPANAYNPLLGAFQVLDSVPTSSASLLHNGRFRSIDETDVTGIESETVSNNGSWSGESEDHKEKTSVPPAARQESIPGADNDKREKIRQKNERKHQRQKEKRAQELHEKCCGYLMSRKLEALAQQLVAMGISQEQATMALIMNEGKVEESIEWFFDRGEEEAKKQSTATPENLKIDITEDLGKITELEIRYKCTKQEAERAVVATEGDLQKAEETLRAQKQENATAPPKPEYSGDSPMSNNGKLLVGLASQNSATKSQPRVTLSPAALLARDHKDFNYTKTPPMTGGPSESVNKTVHAVKRVSQSLDWAKPQHPALLADKSWLNQETNPTNSFSMMSSLQSSPQPAKVATRYLGGGNEFRNLQQQPLTREPITMMQRSQSLNGKVPVVTSISSSSPGTSASWHPSASIEIMNSNGFLPPHHVPSTRSPSPNNLTSNHVYQQLQYQHQQQQQRFSKNLMDSTGISRGNAHQWSRNSTAPPVAAASSLGFFSGLGLTGTSGASSPVDWSTGGSMAHLDYTSIDWSLDRGLSSSLSSPRTNGLFLGSTPPLKSSMVYGSNPNGLGAKPAMGLGVRGSSSGGTPVAGLQNGGGVGVGAEPSSSGASSKEWTSPFEGKDLFSLPRQFVSSPSL